MKPKTKSKTKPGTKPKAAPPVAHGAVMVRTADLKPHPRNYRQHPEDQIEHIKESIRRVGVYRNIVIAQDGTILAGHGVVEACKALGMEEVPVVRLAVDSGSPLALKVLAGDNEVARLGVVDDLGLLGILRTIADEDVSGLLGTGCSDALIAEMTRSASGNQEAKDHSVDINAAEKLNKKWGVKVGDLWRIGKHRLVCGDSTSPEVVRRLLLDKSPNLMVTDPPYGVNYDPAWRNKVMRADGSRVAARATGRVQNDDRADWQAAWALFPGDVVYCWHGGLHASAVAASLVSAGFEIRAQIVWAKHRFVISRGNYHWQHEPCWYAVRKGKAGSWQGDRAQTTLWEIAHGASETGHGTQKPMECMARPIRNHAGDVYEPFAGSGTTLVAAENLGRTCFAVEIHPAYCAVILERMSGGFPSLKISKE